MPPRTATRSTSLAQRAAPVAQRARVIVARAAPVARRVGGAALNAARDEKHTIAALGSAAVLGYADREGMLDSWSLIDGVDPKVQLALGLWLGAKFTKSRTLSHVATGVGSVALYDAIRNR